MADDDGLVLTAPVALPDSRNCHRRTESLLLSTRYAPSVLGVLIPVTALDGGRDLSVDRALLGASYRPRFGYRSPRPQSYR